MTDEKIPTLQGLMTRAYDRWQENKDPETGVNAWSKEDFWDQLDANERQAVFFGNMNYQVQNGGWIQWLDNGYGTAEVREYLKRALHRLGTEASRKVLVLLRRFDREVAQHWDPIRGRYEGPMSDEGFEDLVNDMDREYYEIDDALMADVEADLKKKGGA